MHYLYKYNEPCCGFFKLFIIIISVSRCFHTPSSTLVPPTGESRWFLPGGLNSSASAVLSTAAAASDDAFAN